MKKNSKLKLALNRETLASLQPDVLDAVNGGQAQATVVTTTRLTTTTSLPPPTTRTIQITRELVTRLANCR